MRFEENNTCEVQYNVVIRNIYSGARLLVFKSLLHYLGFLFLRLIKVVANILAKKYLFAVLFCFLIAIVLQGILIFQQNSKI